MTGGPGPLVSDPLKVSPTPDLKRSSGKSVLVFPIQNGNSTALAPEELGEIDRILRNEFEANTTYTVINSLEGAASKEVIAKALKLRQPTMTQALQAGKSAKAPLVLFGSLSRYAPFVGSSSPESPVRFRGPYDVGNFDSPQNDYRGGMASPKSSLPGGVGFNLTLLDVSSGRALWEADFDIQERSVALNLFQLKRQIELANSRGELDEIFRLGVRKAARQLEAERKR